MSRMLRAFGSALLLFGCSSVVAEAPETQIAIRRFYEAHASENIGQCLTPYIDGFTALQVVESDPERMVVDARYMYRDWMRDERAMARGSATPASGMASASSCWSSVTTPGGSSR